MYETCFDNAILHNPYYGEGSCGGHSTISSIPLGQLVPFVSPISPSLSTVRSQVPSLPWNPTVAPNTAASFAQILPANLPEHAARELTLFRENYQLQQENQRLRDENQQLRQLSRGNRYDGQSQRGDRWPRQSFGILQPTADQQLAIFNDDAVSLPTSMRRLQPDQVPGRPSGQWNTSSESSNMTVTPSSILHGPF
jgi:hypothetical protein